jgi:hypothetical protein
LTRNRDAEEDKHKNKEAARAMRHMPGPVAHSLLDRVRHALPRHSLSPADDRDVLYYIHRSGIIEAVRLVATHHDSESVTVYIPSTQRERQTFDDLLYTTAEEAYDDVLMACPKQGQGMVLHTAIAASASTADATYLLTHRRTYLFADASLSATVAKRGGKRGEPPPSPTAALCFDDAGQLWIDPLSQSASLFVAAADGIERLTAATGSRCVSAGMTVLVAANEDDALALLTVSDDGLTLAHAK